MRRWRWAASALILSLLVPGFASAYRYYDAIPIGTVLVAQPEIGLQLLPGPGDRLQVSVELDGSWHSVPVAADGAAFYVPPQPLATGPHMATVLVTGEGNGAPYQSVSQILHFSVSPSARPLPALSLVDMQALVELNAYRAAVHLPPATFSPNLQAASQAHAAYATVNAALYQGASMHTEPDPTAPGFLGADALSRDAAFGVMGGTEVMTFTCATLNGTLAIDDLMDTVFHRFGLLAPGLERAGGGGAAGTPCSADPVGLAGTPFVMDMTVLPVDAAGTASPIEYPTNGQTGVPSEFITEDPSPLPAGASTAAGYPVTVQFPGAGAAALTSAALTVNGHPVPIYTLDSSWRDSDPVYAGDSMGNAVAVIAQSALTPGTTYTVHVKGADTPTGGAPAPFDLSWSFTTAADRTKSVWAQGGTIFATGSFACPGRIDHQWAATDFCSPGLVVSESGSGMPLPDSEPPFADGAADPWATLAINTAWGQGLVQGVAPGAFAPDATLTQAQALAMLARSRGATVSGTSWQAEAEAWAKPAGLLDAATYRPDAPATRAQFVAWIAQAWQVPLQAGATATFGDAASIPAADAPAMAWAQAAGLVTGTGANLVQPMGALTRAQAVTMLVRLLVPS